MAASRTRTRLLRRLRASTRLTAFVLLLFVMKIGVAAACIGHDMADLGFGAGGDHSSQPHTAKLLAPASSDSDGDRTPSTPAHANGGCAHSHSHQAADVVVAPSHAVVPIRHSLTIDIDRWPLDAMPQDQFRPPIV